MSYPLERGDSRVIGPPRHDQRAPQPAVAPAVVVAPQALDLESSPGIQRDRPGVVGPHLEWDLLGAARSRVVLDGGEQRLAAAASPSLGDDRHSDRQNPRGGLLHRRVPDLAALVVLEDPKPRRVTALDDLTEALGAVVDVDRRLGAEESLGGDDGHGAGRLGYVGDTGPADDHTCVVSP